MSICTKEEKDAVWTALEVMFNNNQKQQDVFDGITDLEEFSKLILLLWKFHRLSTSTKEELGYTHDEIEEVVLAQQINSVLYQDLAMLYFIPLTKSKTNSCLFLISTFTREGSMINKINENDYLVHFGIKLPDSFLDYVFSLLIKRGIYGKKLVMFSSFV